jgi:hypothetical protein
MTGAFTIVVTSLVMLMEYAMREKVLGEELMTSTL